jgi:hypothetical protein
LEWAYSGLPIRTRFRLFPYYDMRPAFVFIVLVGVGVGAILCAENALLQRGRQAVEEFERQNVMSEQGNRRLADEGKALQANRSRVEALYLRLKDSLAGPRALPIGSSNRAAARSEEPVDQGSRVIQQLNDAGVITQQNRTTPGELAQIHEAGASRLELHRLIPLLTEQENSNAFLFIDRIVLTRPSSVPPFSSEPTYLDARFTIRVMTGK